MRRGSKPEEEAEEERDEGKTKRDMQASDWEGLR